MKKRGVSPLIATVLLIGFVVAAAGVAMLWTRGFVEEIQEKQGAQGGARLSCATDIQIGVREASFGSGIVQVTVENYKQRVDGFIFVVHGPGGTSSEESVTGVDAGGLNQIQVDYDTIKTGGNPQKVDVIPRIKLGKGAYQPCPDKKITWNFKIQ
ncbi:MAG: hypothetical protein Q8R00_01010 [Candidatus Nanoarchaeia archaeon]|nr:hypothetical protein [Candidatus Nanoarchaeia archaeon]